MIIRTQVMKTVEVAKRVNYNQAWSDPDYNPTDRKFLGFKIGKNPPQKFKDFDSQSTLESLGFEILDSDSTHYLCGLPEGWIVEESGYWTNFIDPNGKTRITQFDKYAYYDRSHFIEILT